MALNPDEIRSQAFPQVKKGGVDGDTVKAFLSVLADDIGAMRHELEAAARAVDEARLEVDNARTEAERARKEAGAAEAAARQQAVSNAPAPQTFAVVGNRVDEVLDAAQRSADAMVRDAEEWSANQRREADEYAMRVRAEVEEMRHATEDQATTYRDETLSYATAVREQADADAAIIRAAAERDAQDQYDRLMVDATGRIEHLKQVERNLLDRLIVTTADLEQAREDFRAMVDNHGDLVIAPTIEPVVAEPIATPELDDAAAAESTETDVTDLPVESADQLELGRDVPAAWIPPVTDEGQAGWTADGGEHDTDAPAGPPAWAAPAGEDLADPGATPADVAGAADPWSTSTPGDWTADAGTITEPGSWTSEAPQDTWVAESPSPEAAADAPAWTTDTATAEPAGEAPAETWGAPPEASAGNGQPDVWSSLPTAPEASATAAVADVSWDPPASSPLDEVPGAWVEPDVQAGSDPWSSVADTGADGAWATAEADIDASADAASPWASATEADPWATPTTSEPDPWATPATGDTDWSVPTASNPPGGPAPASASGSGDDDPLANMVRRAVERVTDGDGKN